MTEENTRSSALVDALIRGSAGCTRLGMELVSAGPDSVVARMPVEGNTQPIGLLHGGITAALCETVGSFLGALDAPPGTVAVGMELSISHHRSVTEGWVIGTAERTHVGRTLGSYTVKVTRESDGKLVSSGYHTCMFRTAPAA